MQEISLWFSMKICWVFWK